MPACDRQHGVLLPKSSTSPKKTQSNITPLVQLLPPLCTELFFLGTYAHNKWWSLTVVLPLPAALVAWSSTKKTRWFHCNCSRSTKASQQLVCTALATGVLLELAPTEIYCIHACTVTMPATRIAAGIPLELRTNVHLNKSNVHRARLFHRHFYPQPKGLSSQRIHGVQNCKSTPSPYSSQTWNVIETSSLFFQKYFCFSQCYQYYSKFTLKLAVTQEPQATI